MTLKPDSKKAFVVCLGLILICWVGYHHVRENDFINWDDDQYVVNNDNINTGLSIENIIWAFGKNDFSYWHPLTWISHMLDCQFFRLDAGWHHIMNLIFHTANALLLFVFLKYATGAFWRSALVAALFAVHPVNVDSVAWIAERKNLLSTFFWMLTSLAYVHYCRRTGVLRYLLVILLFAAGLLAKPTLVTLPFVFILLDLWPLERIGFKFAGTGRADSVQIKHERTGKLILEKVPFFVLSLVSVLVSSFSMRGYVRSIPFELVGPGLRMGNALTSYVKYIAKMFWPSRLAVHYPYPKSVEFWKVFAALLLLLLITIVAIRLFKRRRYLVVGWFWFLGTLAPVSGIIQAGHWPEMADRFAYVPFIGLYIIASWLAADVINSGRFLQKLKTATGLVVLVTLLILTNKQVRLWRDSATLFGHALEVTENNSMMHNNYGNTFFRENRLKEAEFHYRRAVEINPNNAQAHYNLGCIHQERGDINDAIRHYRHSLEVDMRNVNAMNNLGLILASKGQLDEAIEYYEKALQIRPEDADVHYNLGLALAQQNNIEEAIAHLEKALRVRPDFDKAKDKLQRLFEQKK